MLRVFLVIDDYNELLYLQTLLKKLGFDTEGLQNTKKYADVSLGFNPHVLITTAHGRKVNGLELIRSIDKKRGLPKTIALYSGDAPVSEADKKNLDIDLLLESPTSAKKLILGLAHICELDEAALLEKYNKIKATVAENPDEDDMLVVSYDETGKEIAVQSKMFRLSEDRQIGVQFPLKKEPAPEDKAIDMVDLNLSAPEIETPLVDEEQTKLRRERYEKFLASADVPEPGHYSREQIAQFNKKIRSAPPAPDIEEIEHDRKEFVRALYEKEKAKK